MPYWSLGEEQDLTILRNLENMATFTYDDVKFLLITHPCSETLIDSGNILIDQEWLLEF